MGDGESLNIAMFPWIAMGHLTAFLHLSNKLARKGHKIFFLLPKKTQAKLEQFNLHPELIKFVPLIVPNVEGLPPGTETSSDIPMSLQGLLATAMDLTQPVVESFLRETKPSLDFVFFDFQHWLPSVTQPLGIKSVQFWTFNPTSIAYVAREDFPTVSDLMKPPPHFPFPTLRLARHEAQAMHHFLTLTTAAEKEISMMMRLLIAAEDCDAIGFRTCREMEGEVIDFIESTIPSKPILVAGPVVPEAPISDLEERWANWLNQHASLGRKVIFCTFGSECVLEKDQLQQLLLGFELTGLPFLAVVKPPPGSETVEEALPEGFEERTRGKGMVYGGWVQQQLILGHPAVGCFVTHCGFGAISEVIVSECQMVLLPYRCDQVINARLMGEVFKVGVEVKKGEYDGLFTKEALCEAIQMVMDDGSKIGKEVRENHTKLRELLLKDGVESSYISDFVDKLRALKYYTK